MNYGTGRHEQFLLLEVPVESSIYPPALLRFGANCKERNRRKTHSRQVNKVGLFVFLIFSLLSLCGLIVSGYI